MDSYTFLVDRKNIRETAFHTATPVPEAGDGEIVVRIESFALTANNVTYAATGDVLHYWQFFPSQDPVHWGITPCWGFARVEESNVDGVAVGERLYGFLPMASHLVLRPGNIKPFRLTDAAPHREPLPKIYNDYVRLAGLPAWDSSREPHHALFQPLFATAFLLDDFLADADDFGADAVILGSASSKTALGLAHLLHRREVGPRVIGLTSAGNRAFVESIGDYDQVVPYDTIEELQAGQKVAYVDMAGNSDVKRRLHTHYGDNMVYSCAVGTSHWDRFDPNATKDGPLPGAKPAFFFAPSQAVKRSGEWGAAELDRRISEALGHWIGTMNWLNIREVDAADGLQDAFAEVAAGQVPPDTGIIIRNG